MSGTPSTSASTWAQTGRAGDPAGQAGHLAGSCRRRKRLPDVGDAVGNALHRGPRQVGTPVPQPQAVEHRRVVRRPRRASLPGEVGQHERPVGPRLDVAGIRGELPEARVGGELRVEEATDPVQGEPAVVDRAADEPVPFVEDVAPRPLGRVKPAPVDEMAHGAARPDRDHRLAGAREPGPDVGHRAVAPAGDDRQPGGKPRRGRRVPGQASTIASGETRRGKLLGRDARRAQHLRIPRAGRPVEQPRRGGKADVGRPGARERVEDPVLDPHEEARAPGDVRGGVGPPAQADRVVGGAHRAARSRVDGGDVELRPDDSLHAGGPVVRPGHRVRQGRARRYRPGSSCASRR